MNKFWILVAKSVFGSLEYRSDIRDRYRKDNLLSLTDIGPPLDRYTVMTFLKIVLLSQTQYKNACISELS